MASTYNQRMLPRERDRMTTARALHRPPTRPAQRAARDRIRHDCFRQTPGFPLPLRPLRIRRGHRRGRLVYAFDDGPEMVETITVPAPRSCWTRRAAVQRALQLLHLIAGVSYYKAACRRRWHRQLRHRRRYRCAGGNGLPQRPGRDSPTATA
jgi:hypothetical protein